MQNEVREKKGLKVRRKYTHVESHRYCYKSTVSTDAKQGAQSVIK